MAAAGRILTFAKGMLAHGDPERAAREAGYEGKNLAPTVQRLLAHPDVAEVLAAVQRKQVLIDTAKQLAVEQVKHELETREGRIRWLIDVIEGRIKEPKKISYREPGGEEVTDMVDCEPSVSVKLTAHKMLGQMSGDYVERVEVSNTERRHNLAPGLAHAIL